MGFYGRISNQERSVFQFDRIYTSRSEMDAALEDALLYPNKVGADNVAVGRFVLVEYDDGYHLDDFLKVALIDDDGLIYLATQREDDSKGEPNTLLYYSSAKDNKQTTEMYEHPGIDKPNENTIGEGWILYRDIIENGKTERIFYVCNGVEEGIKITVDRDTGTIGTETTENPEEYNKPLLNQIYPTKKDETSLEKVAYAIHYALDLNAYGETYDSTVWTKAIIEIDDDIQTRYVKIADLNTVVPTFDLVVDSPTMMPIKPHFDVDSTNVYYKLHLQPSYGFRVGSPNGGNDNQKDDTEYYYYTDGENEPQKKSLSDEQTYWIKEEYNEETGFTVLKYCQGFEDNGEPIWHEFPKKQPTDVGSGSVHVDSDYIYDIYGFLEKARKGNEDLGGYPNPYIEGSIFYNKAGLDSQLDTTYWTKEETPTGEDPKSEDDRLKRLNKHAYSNEGRTSEVQDYIHLFPTGDSGNTYNYHNNLDKEYNTEDTEEMRISLPSIGNVVSDVHDIIHGPLRNDSIIDSLQGKLDSFNELNEGEIPFYHQVASAADGSKRGYIVGAKVNNNTDIKDETLDKSRPTHFTIQSNDSGKVTGYSKVTQEPSDQILQEKPVIHAVEPMQDYDVGEENFPKLQDVNDNVAKAQFEAYQSDDAWIQTSINHLDLTGNYPTDKKSNSRTLFSIHHNFHKAVDTQTSYDTSIIQNEEQKAASNTPDGGALTDTTMELSNYKYGQNTKWYGDRTSAELLRQDQIQLYTPKVDQTGHVVGHNLELVTLPHGYYKIKTDGISSNKTFETNDGICRPNHINSELTINPGNEWIGIKITDNGDDNIIAINHMYEDRVNKTAIYDKNEDYNKDYTPNAGNDQGWKDEQTLNKLDNKNQVKVKYPQVDEAGHVVGQITETITLPFGFKQVSLDVNNQDTTTEFTSADGSIVAGNTQDTLTLNLDNKWLEGTVSNNIHIDDPTIYLRHKLSDGQNTLGEFTNVPENELVVSAGAEVDNPLAKVRKNNEDIYYYAFGRSPIGGSEGYSLQELCEAGSLTLNLPVFKFDKAGHLEEAHTEKNVLPIDKVFKEILARLNNIEAFLRDQFGDGLDMTEKKYNIPYKGEEEQNNVTYNISTMKYDF